MFRATLVVFVLIGNPMQFKYEHAFASESNCMKFVKQTGDKMIKQRRKFLITKIKGYCIPVKIQGIET